MNSAIRTGVLIGGPLDGKGYHVTIGQAYVLAAQTSLPNGTLAFSLDETRALDQIHMRYYQYELMTVDFPVETQLQFYRYVGEDPHDVQKRRGVIE